MANSSFAGIFSFRGLTRQPNTSACNESLHVLRRALATPVVVVRRPGPFPTDNLMVTGADDPRQIPVVATGCRQKSGRPPKKPPARHAGRRSDPEPKRRSGTAAGGAAAHALEAGAVADHREL